MLRNMGRWLSAVWAAALTMCLGVSAFAAEIPFTGDGSGAMVPIMIGLVAVSAVLIVAFFVLSAKKRK